MSDSEFPEKMDLKLTRAEVLRYGENPHQKAALYLTDEKRPGAATARKAQGKELSYNNLLDADASFECVAELSEPAAVIVKHTNPCGAAIAKSLSEAYKKALACDPVSAFGGIVALNRELDAAVAEELTKLFLEVVIAPSCDDAALKILATKPNLRVLIAGSMPDTGAATLAARSVAGGVLMQERDNSTAAELTIVAKRAPTEQERADMQFAYIVSKHVKSNAIVYAKNGVTVGIGAGQMSRIDSARLAAEKSTMIYHSGEQLHGSVMASDAFLPFPDVVEVAAKAGAVAIIQPGGSKNDQASIDAADAAGMAMVFTGIRHFRH